MRLEQNSRISNFRSNVSRPSNILAVISIGIAIGVAGIVRVEIQNASPLRDEFCRGQGQRADLCQP